MRLHTGRSAAAGTREAVEQAARDALGSVRDPAFALVLCTDNYDVSLLSSTLNAELGSVPWAGCCTAGVFVGTEVFERGIVVGVFEGGDARFAVGVGGPVSDDAREAGRAAVAEALDALGMLESGHHRACIVLPDALTGNAAEVVRGAAHEAGAGIVWGGGGAGDNIRSVGTAQFAHGEAHNNRVVVVAIETARPLGAGLRHGWHPYGPTTQVTRARGATALELDYEPAFDVYRRTAEERGDVVQRDRFAAFAMTHPLGFPQAAGDYIIRDPLKVDGGGGLRCVAEIPEGCMVRVMEGEREDLLRAAGQAAVTSRAGVEGDPGGALVFDCVSRYEILGEHMPDELSAIQAGVGAGVPILGCLTFGEVGTATPGTAQYHNKAVVVLSLPRDPGDGR